MEIKNNEIISGGGIIFPIYNCEYDSLTNVYNSIPNNDSMIIVYAQNASDNPVQGNMSWAYIHKANSSWGNITLVVSNGTIYIRELHNGEWSNWLQKV